MGKEANSFPLINTSSFPAAEFRSFIYVLKGSCMVVHRKLDNPVGARVTLSTSLLACLLLLEEAQTSPAWGSPGFSPCGLLCPCIFMWMVHLNHQTSNVTSLGKQPPNPKNHGFPSPSHSHPHPGFHLGLISMVTLSWYEVYLLISVSPQENKISKQLGVFTVCPGLLSQRLHQTLAHNKCSVNLD